MLSGWVEIDLSAIRHNFKAIKALVGPEVKIMPVVKADAYGHGMIPVSETLIAEGADFLAVSYVEEGIELRKAGISVPIIILLGIFPKDAKTVSSYKLTPVVYSMELARALSDIARENKKDIPIYAKIDTDMGRLGIFYKEAISFLKTLKKLPGLDLKGLTSHLAVAETNPIFTEKQISRFKKIIEEAKNLGINLKYNHIANSAAALQYKESHFQVIRPGLSIYGIYPTDALHEKIALKQAMRFKTKIIYLKKLPPKIGIGYGHTFVTDKETKVAILPIGYDHGFPRSLSNKGEVLIKGMRARVLGTVCMHLTMVDITQIPDIDVGEEVVILGGQGKEVITAEEIAKKAGTISYDIVCALGSRNPKKYLNNTKCQNPNVK